MQGFFSRLLDGDVNGQVNALTGLGRRPDVFRLAITQTVHQDGFNSIPAAQLLVKRAFDSDHPSEIRHAVIEEDIFVGRRIIALQMTEQMACRGVMGVHSHGLNFQVKARQVSRLFGKQGDLRRVEVGQHRHGYEQALIVMFEEFCVLQGHRLMKQRTDAIDQIADHLVARQLAQLDPLIVREPGFRIGPGELAHDPAQVVAVGGPKVRA